MMVMDLLGPSLEDLFNKCSRRFTLKTVLQIADQLLERVDTLHSRHLIHRDIKPANFVIGIGEQGANVYCVDFGLSKRYRHPKNLQHIPHRDGRSLTGTPRYASINNHLGIEQSRRDDLESIGYVLIYFLKGTLPWQGLKAKNAQKKYRMILEKKQQVSIAQLCQGCPSQFAEFLAYTRSLKFDAKPDIPYLRKLFRDMYHAQGCANMGKLWDWDNLDADYSAGADTGAAPVLGANPPRPSTAAAVAPSGGAAMDDQMITDDYAPSNGAGGAPARPSTAGNVGSRNAGAGSGAQKGTWTYTGTDGGASGGQNGSQGGGGERRPHTAGAGRASSSAQQIQHDPRSGTGGAGEEEEGDDAHVVAGARAMMRYRRTRATSQEPAGAPAQQGNVSATGPGNQQLWAGDQGGGYSAQQRQQQQLMQQQQMTAQQQQQQRGKSAGVGGRPSAAAQGGQQMGGQAIAANANGTGWMNGSAAQQMNQAEAGRPKSAGIMNSFQQSGSHTQQANTQAQAQQQTSLSYGSLRSRFLSGGGQQAGGQGTQGQGQGQQAAAQQGGGGAPQGKSNSASKLFSISR